MSYSCYGSVHAFWFFDPMGLAPSYLQAHGSVNKKAMNSIVVRLNHNRDILWDINGMNSEVH
jgi:hypothetical protein